jgi:hypothetical protein
MATVSGRVHRILRRRPTPDGSQRGLARFHDARDEPRVLARFDIPAEHVIGYYQNDDGIDPAVVLITSRGLRFPESAHAPIDFADIKEVQGPPDKGNGPRKVAVTLRDGALRTVPILGRHGPNRKFQDVWEFLRVVMRVVGDEDWRNEPN